MNHYDFHPVKKSYKYLELKLTEEKWILISPLDPEGFLFESVFQHFCTLLDQIFQALRAQLTCNLHTWLVGINNDTAKKNPDLADLCNWKTIQLWNCLDYFKTAKNCSAVILYHIQKQSITHWNATDHILPYLFK